MNNAIDFKETQGFRTWWAWLAVTALNLLFMYAIVQQLIFGKPFGNTPAPGYVLVLIELLLLLLLLFLRSIKLKTRISDAGISYRFYPFQFNETFIEWHELNDAYIRQYNSFYEYGGWGIRAGTSQTGKAINTSASSNLGLQLEFSNGNRLLIGTKRPGEIAQILDSVIDAGKINRRV